MPLGGTGAGDGTEVPQTSGGRWAVPDWLSPSRVIALTSPEPRVVTAPPGVVTRLCVPHPGRVGLYILQSTQVQTEMRVSPFSRPDLFGITLSAAGGYIAVTLADWLSLVNGAWYARSDSGADLLVCELVRP